MRARVAFISIPRLFWMLNLIMVGYGMKWLKGAVAVIFFLVLAGGLFVRTANKFVRDGEIVLRGLDAPVKEMGEMHRLQFVSPIMRKGPLKGLLGGGSHQMDGSGKRCTARCINTTSRIIRRIPPRAI